MVETLFVSEASLPRSVSWFIAGNAFYLAAFALCRTISGLGGLFPFSALSGRLGLALSGAIFFATYFAIRFAVLPVFFSASFTPRAMSPNRHTRYSLWFEFGVSHSVTRKLRPGTRATVINAVVSRF
jgi:hypothetical protein